MTAGELEALLRVHHEASFGWALSCCGWNRDLAEEVLQNTYLKVVEGRAVFASRSSFRTWLFGVIRRTAAEERRNALVLRLWQARLRRRASEPTTGADALSNLVRSEATERLVRALQKLARRQREVLHLVFYQEMSIADAAQVMSLPLGTARTHYERGKRRLRELLRGEEAE